MKTLRLAILLLLAAPAPAYAAEARLASRDLPLRSAAAVRAPRTFDLVGLHWRGEGGVSFRTRALGGKWTAWRVADLDEHADLGGSESVRTRGWHLGEPYWVGPSDRVQYRVRGRVKALRAFFVSSRVSAVPPATVDTAGPVAVVTRSAWRADESIRRGPPRYASELRFAVVHHTAGTNDYGPDESAAIVRGIELYHVQGNGWNDIGYNLLVDRYGQVFEGRYGGIAKNVIGAHSGGFNTGSVGVAVIGTFARVTIPPAARAALVRLLAWRLDVAHADPLSTLTWASGGNSKYPEGTAVPLRTIAGHRDTGYTDCPGDAFYKQLDSIAREVALTGLPKLYEPTVAGTLGGSVSFSADLSTPAAWKVTVSDAAGSVVAGGSGEGETISWVWDSSGAKAPPYSWRMEAGAGFRPAVGTIGPETSPPPPPGPPPPPPPPPPPLVVAAKLGPAVVSPNGDGYADVASVKYRLTRAAYVTATVTDAGGAAVATLFSDQRQSAKTQTWSWAPDAIPDGRYVLRVTARDIAGKKLVARLPVLVDRTLGWLAVAPAAFSPNGDGIADTILFDFRLAIASAVKFRVVQYGKIVTEVWAGPLAAGPQRLLWDGATPAGPIKAGRYDVVFYATGPRGDVPLRGRFTVAPS